MYDLNETDTADVDFALKLIGESPKKILEIACGSGRFLVPMAKAGHDVTGFDFDEYVLAKIESKISSKKLKWYKKDVCCEDWGTGFDRVILAGNFLFNIVSDLPYQQAQELMIQKSADALSLGGYLYIDCGYTFHPEKWFNNPNPNIVWEGKDSHGTYGKMVLLDSAYEVETRINTFVRRFEMILSDGSTLLQEIPSEKHFATLEQIHEWLTQSGFAVEYECGDYDGNPISEDTKRAIIFAKKVRERI